MRWPENPGYSSAESLSKEAKLVRTATQYQVDASKITARVTTELSAKRRSGPIPQSEEGGKKLN